MATKWRSRILSALWIFFFTFGLSGPIAIMTFGNQFYHENYFETTDFQSQIDEFAGDINSLEIYDVTIEEAKKNITVSTEEMEEYRYRYGDLNQQITSIKDQYEFRIQEAKDSHNKEVADALIAERDSKIKDITKNFSSDKYVREKITKEKEQGIDDFFKKRENLRTNFLQRGEVFKYYFKDTATGKVYSNLNLSNKDSVEDYMNEKEMLYVTNYTITRDQFFNSSFLGYDQLEEPVLPKKTGNIEGKIGIPKTISSSSPEIENYKNYEQMQVLLTIYTIASIISLIVTLIFVKKIKVIPSEFEKGLHYYYKIPIDFRIILLGITIFMSTLYLVMASDQLTFIKQSPVQFGIELLIDLVIAAIFIALVVAQVKFLVPLLKDGVQIKREWKNSFLSEAWNKVQDLFLIQRMGVQLIIVFTLILMVGLILGLLSLSANLTIIHFSILLFLFIGIPGFIYSLLQIGRFNRIVQKTTELAAGTLGPDLPVKGKSILARLAANINVLKQGVKTSQNEQAKSERLKTELITNVSHDLRTPLTSIINYTELLKKNDLSIEEKTAYLEIIDRKSKRLKVLIDDLFEVSKMASGNMELTKSKVDLVQLLQQALAEYDETIKNSSLQFRVSHSEKPIYAIVDGQKLWRVFDNLIGNILKYSMENTRVFINITKKGDKAEISFKNISKFELGENSDELFERFKRGDTSRHTEGSGLGLAIAKSIIDLHNGKLDIGIDGDLFKVSIEIPDSL